MLRILCRPPPQPNPQSPHHRPKLVEPKNACPAVRRCRRWLCRSARDWIIGVYRVHPGRRRAVYRCSTGLAEDSCYFKSVGNPRKSKMSQVQCDVRHAPRPTSGVAWGGRQVETCGRNWIKRVRVDSGRDMLQVLTDCVNRRSRLHRRPGLCWPPSPLFSRCAVKRRQRTTGNRCPRSRKRAFRPGRLPVFSPWPKPNACWKALGKIADFFPTASRCG